MKKAIIYTTNICPYCVRAKSLLQKKGIEYEEIKVDNAEIQQEMITKSNGRRTVPQIFIGGTHIGGFDELYALEKANKLDQI